MSDVVSNSAVHGSCHCGRISLVIPELPNQVTVCNCSICRRYAAVWGYYRHRTVALVMRDEAGCGYQWNDHMISFVHCRYCGCLTHYEDVAGAGERRLAVNFRMVDPTLWQDIHVRRFDGADTFQEIN